MKLQIQHSEAFPIPLPEGHRFPISKYELVRMQLEHEGYLNDITLISSYPIPDEAIHLVHEPAYWQRVKQLALTDREVRRVGFPQCQELVLRSASSAAGTLEAARFALLSGLGMNLAGGTHHAFRNAGEGFCTINDMAIAIRQLQSEGLIRNALVIDLDVHQGNGTAAIFAHDPGVRTVDIHCADNYPLHKMQPDISVPLPAGTTDSGYLGIVGELIERELASSRPDIIFYQSGVDILTSDRLGKLFISPEGCKKRDEIVISGAFRHSTPIVVVMGGGYSARLADTVSAHANTYKTAIDLYHAHLAS